MALDFPASPTNGQVFGNWTYNSTKGVWQSSPLTQVKTSISSSAPSSPSVGDQWFNSNDGTLSIYYNDGSSAQWVETRAPITADGYKSPNYLINGAFDVWQRGTSGFTTNNGYCADRWIASIVSSTVSRVALPTGSDATYGLLFTTSSATNANGIIQALESSNANMLRGKTVTLSFYAQTSVAGQTLLADIQTSSTADSATVGFAVLKRETLTTSTVRTRYTVTATIPADSTSAGIRVVIASSNIPSGSTMTISNVQLEEGVSATTFRRNANSIQGELAACQRYFWRFNPDGIAGVYVGTRNSAGQAEYGIQFPVIMRVTPTLSANVLGSVFSYGASSAVTVSSWGGTLKSTQHYLAIATCSTTVGGAQGTATNLDYSKLDFSAEL